MLKKTLHYPINDLTSYCDPSRCFQIGIALLLACAFLPTVLSASSDPGRYRSGLRNSNGSKKLNEKQLAVVLKSLRDKTGFLELGFDENGFLTIGDRTKFISGSATARALLSAALEFNRAIDLECHNYSSEIAFARLARPIIFQSRLTGETIEVLPVELDFSDFTKLRGDKKVLAAFDIGFVILHELGHAVLGLQDTLDDPTGLGECEEYINRIRRELSLPERQNYLARTYQRSFSATQRIFEQAELVFVQHGETQGRATPQKFLLSWEAALVGPIRQAIVSSESKPRVSKSVTATLNGQ